jgi:hypothetical protein
MHVPRPESYASVPVFSAMASAISSRLTGSAVAALKMWYGQRATTATVSEVVILVAGSASVVRGWAIHWHGPTGRCGATAP